MHVEDIRNSFLDHNLILLGDYKLPAVTWHPLKDFASPNFEENSTTLTRSCTSALVNNFISMGLKQFNFIKNSRDNMLDLCFSCLPCSVSLSHDILSKMDEFHPILNIATTYFSDNANLDSSFSPLGYDWDRYNFRKCNFDILTQGLCEVN